VSLNEAVALDHSADLFVAVVVEQVGEGLDLNRAELDPGAEEAEVAVKGGADAGVVAEYGALADRIGRVERNRSDLRLAAHRVEGLLVLAPADRADPALIVEIDPLAPESDRGGLVLVLQLQPVELDVFRVDDHRKAGPELADRRVRQVQVAGKGIVVVAEG
jgi:hypothetical protein